MTRMRSFFAFPAFALGSAMLGSCGGLSLQQLHPITIELTGTPSEYAGIPVYLELETAESFLYTSGTAWAYGIIDTDGSTALAARVLSHKDEDDETHTDESFFAFVGSEATFDIRIDGDGDGRYSTVGVDVAENGSFNAYVGEGGAITVPFGELEKIQ
ncbi:MAG: hypothetical protein A2Z99_02950 [Treponema sp. GWB1_62_6]|nr:MAG: hypothetical protein A2Y36_05545 [Treponema sp. GWA1_62_8]OHE69663.1 MAG: hypothetical protein A2001_08895 [Treponema sp. GWC1_61_84]OHE71345.1 MAG: hypothetical protein A2Z99_02950 [Treponema sp. GWB1_62_6]HCM24995.1 hypothetical protein [Treponema sp.]